MNTENQTAVVEESALSAIVAEADLDIEDELQALMDEELSAEPVQEEAVQANTVDELDELTGFEEPAETTAEDKKSKKEAAAKKVADAVGEEPKKREVKRTSTANMSCSEAIVHKLGSARYDVCIPNTAVAALTGKDLEASVDEFVKGLDILPKKVREKVLNVFCNINSGVTLSTYTRVAFDMLKDAGELSTDTLRDHYINGPRPYSPGTASAQSSQMFQLLPALGIATREGKMMKLAEDSVLKDML